MVQKVEEAVKELAEAAPWFDAEGLARRMQEGQGPVRAFFWLQLAEMAAGRWPTCQIWLLVYLGGMVHIVLGCSGGFPF